MSVRVPVSMRSCTTLTRLHARWTVGWLTPNSRATDRIERPLSRHVAECVPCAPCPKPARPVPGSCRSLRLAFEFSIVAARPPKLNGTCIAPPLPGCGPLAARSRAWDRSVSTAAQWPQRSTAPLLHVVAVAQALGDDPVAASVECAEPWFLVHDPYVTIVKSPFREAHRRKPGGNQMPELPAKTSAFFPTPLPGLSRATSAGWHTGQVPHHPSHVVRSAVQPHGRQRRQMPAQADRGPENRQFRVPPVLDAQVEALLLPRHGCTASPGGPQRKGHLCPRVRRRQALPRGSCTGPPRTVHFALLHPACQPQFSRPTHGSPSPSGGPPRQVDAMTSDLERALHVHVGAAAVEVRNLVGNQTRGRRMPPLAECWRAGAILEDARLNLSAGWWANLLRIAGIARGMADRLRSLYHAYRDPDDIPPGTYANAMREAQKRRAGSGN